ncbi:hypothetical protein B0T13DRAFT_1637 [Neurospora crassa]|nr:hypothetical protein B0T13DRAFT_1637 [Neurospora crassa]
MPSDAPDTSRRPSAKRWSTTESLRRGRGPPTCRVPQCRDTAVPIAGAFDNEILLSLYCKRHTCRWEYPPYDRSCCPDPVTSGQDLCDHHEQLLSCACTTEPCLQKRDYEEVADSVDPTAPWFCSTHRCGQDRCDKEGTGSDQHNRRCDKHKRCDVPDCLSPPDVQNDSFYCKRHTCRSAHCPNVAKKNNLCTEHQRCVREGCNKPRYWPDTGLDDLDAPPLCETHFKQKARCANPDCMRPKENGQGRYCSEHECKSGGCPEERDSSGSPYCRKHRCRIDGCPDPLVNGSSTGTGLFCPQHTCKVPSCQRSIATTNSSHCEIHSCSKPDCPNPADIISSSKASAKPVPPLCKLHKCKIASCSEEAIPISDTTAGYCHAKHECIEDACQKGRLYDDQGTPFERCADHERQRWKDAGRRDAEEAMEAEDAARKKNELKKDRQHAEEKDALKDEIRQLRDIIHGPEGIEAFRQELEDLRAETARLRAENEGLRAAHDAHQARLRKGRRPSMAATSPGFYPNGIPTTTPGPGEYLPFRPPDGHPLAGPGPMPIPGMNGSKPGRESPVSRSFRGSNVWDTSRDSLLSHQMYEDHEYPYYSEEDRGGTPTDISFDHNSELDPTQQPSRGRIRDVPVDWRDSPTPGREPRGREAREMRDKSRGRVRGGTTDTIKEGEVVVGSPRDKSKARRTKSKHRTSGGYGAYDAIRRRSGAGLSHQWHGDATQVSQPPPLSSRKSKTFGTGKPRPVSMAGSVPDGLYAGGGYAGHAAPGHMGYWGPRGHGDYYDSEE